MRLAAGGRERSIGLHGVAGVAAPCPHEQSRRLRLRTDRRYTLLRPPCVASVRPSGRIALISLQNLFEWPQDIRVKWVRSVGVCREVAPVFVHPKPGRGIFSNVRLKRIPAFLRDLLVRHLGGGIDLRMKNYSVTSVLQGLAVRGNNRDAGPFVQPGMRGSHTCF